MGAITHYFISQGKHLGQNCTVTMIISGRQVTGVMLTEGTYRDINKPAFTMDET